MEAMAVLLFYFYTHIQGPTFHESAQRTTPTWRIDEVPWTPQATSSFATALAKI